MLSIIFESICINLFSAKISGQTSKNQGSYNYFNFCFFVCHLELKSKVTHRLAKKFF